jgi:hypothetical protein
VARTRVGFTPATGERLTEKLRPLEIPECPFANLPGALGPVGRGPYCGQDEGMRLGAAGTGRGGGVRRVDAGGEAAARAVCWDTRGLGSVMLSARTIANGVSRGVALTTFEYGVIQEHP